MNKQAEYMLRMGKDQSFERHYLVEIDMNSDRQII